MRGGIVNRERLTGHLEVDRYGDFQLTDAIRPAPHVPVMPREGFRMDVYRDNDANMEVPVLAAAVTRERLFDVFLSLLDALGPCVDVVLETSHHSDTSKHRDLLREGIDLPVLQSHLCEFEDLLLNDGCTGVAVISGTGSAEVQFDEHKLLVVYAHDLEPFEAVLRQAGIKRDDRLRLITEGEHLHSTAPSYYDQFEQLCCRAGVSETAEHVSW
jgi:hypothetical protein